MALLEVAGIGKSFGSTAVLRNISFELQKGEALAIIGSSGSGKTTLLRCLNFLETADAGSITVAGETLWSADDARTQSEAVLRKKRLHFGLVFQNFNLFPQYTALQNVMLAGELLAKERPDYKQNRKQIHDELETHARELLAQMGLSDRAGHYPHQLSGGQQQRVALARAIVTRPKVLLLDEPLSAIDAKLRKNLQSEIHRIQKQLNITMIFVTHDQDEAMVMSDRICLLNGGKIEQMDTPIAIYTHPRTKFAAGFIGSYNVLEPLEFGRVTGDIDLPAQPIAIRPEVLNIAREKQGLPGTYDIQGTVIDSTPRGNVLRYKVEVNGVQLAADTLFRSFSIYENGSKVWLSLEKRNCLQVEEAV